MPSKWMTLKEVSEYLSVARETTHRLLKNKNLPAHRIGKLWRFDKEEVDAWVLSGGSAFHKNPEGRNVWNTVPQEK